MFLSLPVFQDPAPWNIVWRAGELFTIDVGDGLTMEQRTVPDGKSAWDVFAQKYIGSVNECYRMSLKALCGACGLSRAGTKAKMAARAWAALQDAGGVAALFAGDASFSPVRKKQRTATGAGGVTAGKVTDVLCLCLCAHHPQ